LVGVGTNGTTALANGQSGIQILNSSNTTLSNVTSSRNALHGVYLRGNSTTTTINGSVMSGNTQNGILIADSAANTTVTSSKIGVTATNAVLGNGVSGVSVATTGVSTVVKSSTISNNFQFGVLVTSARGGEVGGLGKTDGNTLSKNGAGGLSFRGTVGGASTLRVGGNTVSGSAVGMSLYGTTGLEVVSSVFSANTQQGIYAEGAFTSTTVKGVTSRNNAIGVRVNNATNFRFDGTTAAIRVEGNTTYGILVTGTCTGTMIAGSVVNQGQYGIGLNSDTQRTTSGVTLSNNIVINASIAGVSISAGTVSGCSIVGNTISGNDTGVLVIGSGAVIGSALGTTLDDPDANLITNSKGWGIKVVGATAIDNTMLSNSIYGNVAGGITLVSGGNANQVAPTVTGATLSGTDVAITGTITGTVGATYRIQYFTSLARDAASASQVQGRTLLGYLDVTIGAGGTAAIDQVLAGYDIAANDWVSATATQIVGGVLKNTSPFALGVRVVG
jgi:hypothetical protein